MVTLPLYSLNVLPSTMRCDEERARRKAGGGIASQWWLVRGRATTCQNAHSLARSFSLSRATRALAAHAKERESVRERARTYSTEPYSGAISSYASGCVCTCVVIAAGHGLWGLSACAARGGAACYPVLLHTTALHPNTADAALCMRAGAHMQGRRLLRLWLLRPLVNLDVLGDRLDAVDYFRRHLDAAEALRCRTCCCGAVLAAVGCSRSSGAWGSAACGNAW